MNFIFKPLLRKGVLVFYDDILVYSLIAKHHQQVLYKVFQLMRIHILFAKRNKCHFGLEKVE